MTTIYVQEDPETKDLFLEFPDDLIASLGWQAGDTIQWDDAGEGRWVLTKKVQEDSTDGS